MFDGKCGTTVEDRAGSRGYLPAAGPDRSGDSFRVMFFGRPPGGKSDGGSAGGDRTGLPGNATALLCYVLGWVTGIVFLVVDNDDRLVRFHAWQSILTFGTVTLIYVLLNVLAGLFFTGPWRPLLVWTALYTLAGAASFLLWLILMVKAYQGQRWKVPLLGELAERYAGF